MESSSSIPAPHRLETLRTGYGVLPNTDFRWDVRIVRDASKPDALYAVWAVSLHGPFASDEQILASLTATFETLVWRSGPLVSGEVSCPICAAAQPAWPRYPRAVCPVCVLESIDERRRLLRFYNAPNAESFVAHRDDGTETTEHRCWIRGRRCRADAAYTGGIVVQLDE